MESEMPTVGLGWWSEYIYEKLKRENIAVDGGSGVMSMVESVGSLWPKIDDGVRSKRWEPRVGVSNFLPSFFIQKKKENAISDSSMSISPVITSYYYCQGVWYIQINAATDNWCSWLSYCQQAFPSCGGLLSYYLCYCATYHHYNHHLLGGKM